MSPVTISLQTWNGPFESINSQGQNDFGFNISLFFLRLFKGRHKINHQIIPHRKIIKLLCRIKCYDPAVSFSMQFPQLDRHIPGCFGFF